MRQTRISDLRDTGAIGTGDGARLGAPPRAGFTERNAGTIISLAVHIALFVILSSTAVPRISNASPRPEPFRIVFDQPATRAPEAPEVPDALEAQEGPESPQYKGAAKTAAETAENATEEARLSETQVASLKRETDAALIEPEAAELSDEGRQQASEDRQEPELSTEVMKDLNEQRAQLKELNEKVSREGSSEVAQRLRLARVKIEGQRWLETTEGEAEGVVRSMSTLGVPPSAADEVCAQYGIRIILAQVDASDVTGGFLNRAETASGTYYNRVGKGQYQVFTFSERALARMVRIERDELAKRGHDPGRTRVLEVGYGIVQTPSGYDLGIKKFRVAPIELEP